MQLQEVKEMWTARHLVADGLGAFGEPTFLPEAFILAPSAAARPLLSYFPFGNRQLNYSPINSLTYLGAGEPKESILS